VADNNPQSDNSEVRPERRVLLFQVDMTNKTLPAVLSPRWTYAQGVPDQAVAISDYSDYDNPRTLLYWRNKLADNYPEILQSSFENFAADIFTELNNGRLNLRRDKKRPFLDLTPFVKTMSNYSVAAKDLSNTVKLSLARPANFSDLDLPSFRFGSTRPGQTNRDADGLLPRENDVIMILTRYPGGQFFQEYLGFITKVEDGSSYGQIDRYEISVDGISKITKQSEIVRQQAITNDQFLPNLELNRQDQMAVFSDQYNELDIRAIFSKLMDLVFANKIVETETPGDIEPSVDTFRLNPSVFCPLIVPVAGADGIPPHNKVVYPEGAGGFQHNFFALLTLFLMTIQKTNDDELFPPRTDTAVTDISRDYYQQLKILRDDSDGDSSSIPADDTQVILSPVNRAVIEHGGNEAFNKLIANGFENFFSHMVKPDELFSEIRNTAYYDVFESREGIIVCRPPRYNKIEITHSESSRTSGKSFIYDQASSTWEFNPNADFFIRKDEVLDIPSRVLDDDVLESRSDVQLNMTLVGSQNFPSGTYTDADVLLRFGLKTHGVISNPNALNTSAPKIFAPLILAMVNAASRTASVVVKDSRRFRIGKLYYIESLDSVGYLVEDSISDGYGALSSRTLSFSMVRRVVRRPLVEIVNGVDGKNYEALNLALCYTEDPPDSDTSDVSEVAQKFGFGLDAKSFLGLWTAKGKVTAERLLKASPAPDPQASTQNDAAPSTGARIVMFRYIPNILDISLTVEANPDFANPDPNTNKVVNKSVDDRVIAGVLNGKVAVSSGFLKPENQQVYDAGAYFPQFLSEANFNGPIYKNPDSKIAIPAGAISYNEQKNPMANSKGDPWYESEQLPANILSLTATPFQASAIAEKPQNIKMSQLLVNKLASADISLKFGIPTSINNYNIIINLFKIPQLYWFSGKKFWLFCPDVDPSTFMDSLAARQGQIFGSDTMASELISNLTSLGVGGANCPSVLSMDIQGGSLNEFSNPQYRIVGSGGEFWLPYGHFFIPRKSSPASSAFIIARSKQNPLLGGKFKVSLSPDAPNTVVVKPSDPSKYELISDNGTLGGKGTPLTKISLSLDVDHRLYFMTPFAEPTIERLLDFPLPIAYGGQLSQETADAQKANVQKKNPGVGTLNSNKRRLSGDAINVSIDYLAAASGSDLEVYPRRVTSPVNSNRFGGIWGKFERGIADQNIAKEDPLALFRDVDSVMFYQNALKATTKYPGGGKPPTTRECLVYTLQITGAEDTVLGLGENRKYATTITNAKPQPQAGTRVVTVIEKALQPPPGETGA
jgi:hypothetical protein